MSEPTAAENAEQEKQLLAALEKLLEDYSNYDAPYLRKRRRYCYSARCYFKEESCCL